MPTAKLGVCDIKFQAAYPDKIKSKTPFLWGVAPSPIRFLKKTKQKTFKLGHSAIKAQTATPDKIKNARRLTTTVERTFFEKQPKIFPVGKFLALPFFKKVAKNLNTN